MATYHFDNTAGNDTTGDGSSGSPWKTLAKAEAIAAAGDTLLFKKGETWTTKGTANATCFLYLTVDNITINAYGSGNNPIFNLGGTVRNGIFFEADGGTVLNFKLYNSGGGSGALFSSSGSGNSNTIQDSLMLTANHSDGDGAASGIGATVIVRNCTIDGCNDDGVTTHGDGSAGGSIYVYDTIIRNCFDGINCSSTGGVMTSVFEDCTFYNNSSHDIGDLSYGTAVFRRCRFGHQDQSGQSPSMMQLGTNTSSVEFEYCIIDGTHSSSNGQPAITNSISGCTCTFKNCVFRGASGVVSYTGQVVCWPGSITFTNCIFSYWFQNAYQTGGGVAYTNYCINHNVSNWNPTATNSVGTGDPLLVDPANGDFHLSSTSSPAYNAGTNLSLATDFYGNAVDSIPSLGVHEFTPPPDLMPNLFWNSI